MPFRDRTDAGRQLAAKLTRHAGRPDVIVLALPRGGVPVAYEVATALGAPLDVLVVARLVAFSNHDVTIGAVAGDGIRVVDEELCGALHVSPDEVVEIAERAQAEVDRRQRLYRDCQSPLDVRDRTVILVDDGMATGASMRTAVVAIQERRPAATVVAVPVASYATCAEIARKVDEIVYCFIRDPVYSVGLWYESYPPVSDEEACRLLRQARTQVPQTRPSPEHYRELGADSTVAREQSFAERGFPPTGPDLGEDDAGRAEPRHPPAATGRGRNR